MLKLASISIQQQKTIEQMKNQDNQSIFDGSEQRSVNNQSQSSRDKKKKIKKKHKKQSRLAADVNHRHIPVISQFVQQGEAYFKESRQELLERCRFGKGDIVSMIRETKAIFNIKQNDCQSETFRYIQLLKTIQHSNYQKIAISSHSHAIALPILRSFINYEDPRILFKHLTFLTSNEHYLLHAREEARHWLTQKIDFLAKEIGYKEHQIQYIEPHMEMITLFKINKQVERQLESLVNTYTSREDPLFNSHVQHTQAYSLHLQNIYIRAMIIKNFQKGFSEQPIDFYNYHKAIQNYEQNNFEHGKFERIKTMTQFQKYLQIRKPRGKSKDSERRGKERKYQKNHLRTPCSACFSDYSEQSNPIQKCPECQNRAHKSCQNVNRCHRCRYCRTSKKQREQTGFCYICDRSSEKGLMILTVTNSSPHYYAHSFCLLVHNLWRVEDSQFKGKFIKIKQNASPCQICKNESRKGILVDCQGCGTTMHAMCAYLAGLSFRMHKQQNGEQMLYTISIDCCISEELRERLCFERKFKLNYEKVVFRRQRKFKPSEQLYEYIERKLSKEA